MKPMKSMIHAIATLLLMGVVLTSCAEDVWFQDGNAHYRNSDRCPCTYYSHTPGV